MAVVIAPEDPGYDSQEAPDIDEIELPDIDSGGDGDLNTGVLSLFSTVPDWNPVTGILAFDYTSGPDLKRDLRIDPRVRITGVPQKRHLHFEGAEGVGLMWGEIGYSFAGNTKGKLIHKAVFKHGTAIDFKVRYQLVLPNDPHFIFFINSNGKGNSYIGSDFGAYLKLTGDGRATKTLPHPDKMFKMRPHLWVDKKIDYHYRISFNKKEGAKEGVVTVHMNEMLMFKQATTKDAGQVGFYWNNVKFVVQELQIKGLLDQDWAREEIDKLPRSKRSGAGDDEEDLDF